MELPVISRLNTAFRTSRITREFGIDALVSVLESYLPDDEIAIVREAHEYGAAMHAGQFRKTGEPYIFHPLAVARILAEMRMDYTTLVAAILHDVIEDTPAAKHEVAERFGEEVAHIVDGVSKLDRATDQSREEAQAESLRKLMMAMTDDLRVILVKLADRLHNMRTLATMATEKRRRVARETLEIYAPIAHRLGIHTLRNELEDLGFANRYPKRHRVLKRSVEAVAGRRKDLIREVEDKLNRRLSEEGIGAAVFGRRKNLYGVYQKMRKKHLRFLDVMDLYGFRVIVDSEDACYRALGVVHSMYQPISEQFNDYIACPKVNGYQSLHTTLIGPKGVKIEVQIRTRDQNHIAESGVAAHWQYKLGRDQARQAPEQRAREWLAGLVEVNRRTANAMDFMESVRVDLFPDEVYVFSPKGQIYRLVKGATALDLAYAIHTDLGNSAVSAWIDDHLQALSTPLSNGQQVRIVTARHQSPNATWLNFVKTGKARSAILHHLRHQRADESRRLGRRLLTMALHERGMSLRKLDPDKIEVLLKTLKEPDMERVFESIGNGRRMASLVAHQLESGSTASSDKPHALAIEGTEGMAVEFAGCCRPIPGDRIRGVIRSGRGIVIHQANCKNGLVGDRQSGTQVDVVWSENVNGEYPVELRVQGENKRGLLGRVATALAEEECSIDHVKIKDKQGDIAELSLLVTVSDRTHLSRMLRQVRKLPSVVKVVRAGSESSVSDAAQRSKQDKK
ncbi:RelA/SpoT family protein [Oceanococcus atlanticus]|uniref:guanosine-3',5'-bis(diphosphate) 3'-diphosphatase n=1 Tax=Oceanococcus atlanticus TaxID=1317117 RepID=A0A1Y1SBP5_9GAMM|nr:bifunctional (p)ppGpp synthetase/guanosine-3',5'-bis(diphosphate) 3'-pyrophosphohydrolase [Oceanococcus atlanticus]ORE85564.1 RelA/SpoT family protein [Oceanococcus atlanticus]RZO82610.1 MAG: bifunctional (p)ppGpp synthetase/guanosine-3',5'-bis(diphosphate) 3'-pyrophosphohydrolase [Oceanococcus sp.]